MMTTITTKYSEGETVYFASTVSEKRKHDCPDCLGKKEWGVTSPSGTDYTFQCPRCAAPYMHNSSLSLAYQAYVPSAQKLTIGSVQFNTATTAWDKGARYMCYETGIGSGAVYNEEALFYTESAALEYAAHKAEEQNLTIPNIVNRYNETLKVSDYQLCNAMIVDAKKQISDSQSLLYNLQELQNDIIDRAETLGDAQDYFAEYMAREWEKDKVEAS
jgi:hypothetical protein